jgi:hypothetical protein
MCAIRLALRVQLAPEVRMLRRVNAALFEAPPGALIRVVAEAQGNNGVNDARFEYAGQILPRETILGLPGCSFTVADFSERLEAVVVFDPGAPGSARYDLFEVENGVKNDLQKSTRHSESTPLISFTIDPVLVAVSARSRAAALRWAVRHAARKKARKRAAVKRKPAKKKPARKKPVKKKARTYRKRAK